ncbi:hypothetical protein PIB30_112604, partial [Stylosanthes scabra]|nr:hypothetical protein [Stylosanthes scabra]
VVPSTQAPLDPSPQPTPTDSGAAVAPVGGVDADSSHGSQQVPSAAPPTKTAITWDEQKGYVILRLWFLFTCLILFNNIIVDN